MVPDILKKPNKREQRQRLLEEIRTCFGTWIDIRKCLHAPSSKSQVYFLFFRGKFKKFKI